MNAKHVLKTLEEYNSQKFVQSFLLFVTGSYYIQQRPFIADFYCKPGTIAKSIQK